MPKYKTIKHNAFYCPDELKEGFEKMGYCTLGSTITYPLGTTTFKVLSGPLCRLYYDNGKLTPHLNETYGHKYRIAYLSYLVQIDNFPPRELTVRWETPDEIKQLEKRKKENALKRQANPRKSA